MIYTAAPGPGFHHCFKFGLVIVAATFLGSCLSAPTKEPHLDDPWWFNPCNSDLPDPSKLRHGRSAHATLPVKRQLKKFVIELQGSMKKINSLYSAKKGPGKGPMAKLKWLKIKKMLRDMQKSKRQPQMLEKFHVALQHFAGTLEVLRTTRIETDVVNFNQTERDSIYQAIGYQLRNLLCELEEKNGSKVPKIPLKAMHIPRKDTLDYTYGHITDVNFFKKTISFFNKSQQILFKNRVKNKSRAVKKAKRT